MSAVQPLYFLLDVNPTKFSKIEYLFLEAELFIRVCAEIKERFRKQLRQSFYLKHFTTEMEDAMLEANFLRLVINDILSTEEYTIEGIARYTGTHEDVVYEVITGRNLMPSAVLLQKSIQLHRTVRSDLYREIMNKIASECSNAA